MLNKKPKYKINQFIQHKNEENFHGNIIDEAFQIQNGEFLYQVNDHGEIVFLYETTIDKYYEVVE